MDYYIPLAVLAVFAALAAWTDVTRRRISNWLCLACAVAGLAIATWLGGAEALGWHAAHMGVALLIGMALFAIGAVGGGDGKFYAAVASFFPLQQGFTLGAAIGLSGGVLLLIFIIWRRVIRRNARSPDAGGITKDNSAKLPYGVAIGVGALAATILSN